jgi:hypothetical protein
VYVLQTSKDIDVADSDDIVRGKVMVSNTFFI